MSGQKKRQRLGATRSSPRSSMSRSASDDVILGPRRLLRPPSAALRSARQAPVEPGLGAFSLRSVINRCSMTFVKFFSRLNCERAASGQRTDSSRPVPCGRSSSLTDYRSQQSPSWRLERAQSPQSSPALPGPVCRARSFDSMVPPRPSPSKERAIQLLRTLQATRRRSSSGADTAPPASTPAIQTSMSLKGQTSPEVPGPHVRRHRPSARSAGREQQDRTPGTSADRSRRASGPTLPPAGGGAASPTPRVAEARALLDRSRRRWSSIS